MSKDLLNNWLFYLRFAMMENINKFSIYNYISKWDKKIQIQNLVKILLFLELTCYLMKSLWVLNGKRIKVYLTIYFYS